MKDVGKLGIMALLQGILQINTLLLMKSETWSVELAIFNALGSEHCRHGETGRGKDLEIAAKFDVFCARKELEYETDICYYWIIQNSWDYLYFGRF